ncbi:DUF4249 domain-containing protein [Flagellimonas nanhaiensis]|uniref:DUF4249 domain-containing protein n=1 Tax=Flagellimonas nanhaiensis TaxID=2292706 RepID=A0A371JUD4_9FLAO|nr:DUF4249 domain-containing protein [Allomuricauda nanhaiensis]RDY61415.1 DUF4249 domain-containing protein [Allomuricauda nanhaiensis]
MRRTSITYRCLLPVFTGCLLSSCIEPFEVTFRDFESALVIDATLTNELKQQKILISRTYRFEDEGAAGVSGATVQVVSEDGSRYDFTETDSGTYVSSEVFAAQTNVGYTLLVGTKDGQEYTSDIARTSGTSKIDSLYAQRVSNDFGEEGMGMFLNASNLDSDTNFYRYEYEETYKIIAPEWNPVELDVDEEIDPPGIFFTTRSLGERVCYGSNSSNKIILASTENLNEGRISNFMVHFVDRNNYILSHRYSILVRQYSQSTRAHDFYETLNNFSNSESLFSETQPGFLEGNISPIGNQDEKVLGYFNVVNVDEKRIFFNYEDFFPGERLPPYVDPCREGAPGIGLIDLVRWDLVKYVRDNEGEFPGAGPYVTVPEVCGDCTVLGSSEIPEFWID